MNARPRRIKRVLVVDDEEVWLRALVREARPELDVFTAKNSNEAKRAIAMKRPDVAVIDLHLGSESGLELLAELRERYNGLTLVLVSSYMTIPTTVAAMKAGANHVDIKPITCRQVVSKLEGSPVPDDPVSLARVEWEYVQRVLYECGGNRTAAAKALGIYRQSLQRKLRKRPPAQ
jgi:two-component system response regulator RegA